MPEKLLGRSNKGKEIEHGQGSGSGVQSQVGGNSDLLLEAFLNGARTGGAAVEFFKPGSPYSGLSGVRRVLQDRECVQLDEWEFYIRG